MKLKIAIILAVLFQLCGAGAPAALADSGGASLYIKPGSGNFSVGSTFEVGIYLNTGGNNVNAIKVNLSFPPDKLQVVSPSVGKSFVQFWVLQPTFSNAAGTVSLEGGIPPPGLNTSEGLVSTVVFRVVGTGQAIVTIKDGSQVFLADGKGTNVLGSVSHGLFNLRLPPPAGPIVVAPDYPDPTQWYQQKDAVFAWEMPQGATQVSYILNSDPLDIPDDIPEGAKTSVTYRDLPSGVHYFHIKALNSSSGWGSASHYVINIDHDSPADFKVEVSPWPRTVVRQPTLIFSTTDSDSGINHYMLKVINTGQPESGVTPFFIEVTSPFVLPVLEPGKYDIVVRAFDLAGNFREVHQKLQITTSIFGNVNAEGISMYSNIILPWWVLYIILIILIILGLYFLGFAVKGAKEAERKLAVGVLNLIEHRVSRHLNALQQKRDEFESLKHKTQP